MQLELCWVGLFLLQEQLQGPKYLAKVVEPSFTKQFGKSIS